MLTLPNLSYKIPNFKHDNNQISLISSKYNSIRALKSDNSLVEIIKDQVTDKLTGLAVAGALAGEYLVTRGEIATHSNDEVKVKYTEYTPAPVVNITIPYVAPAPAVPATTPPPLTSSTVGTDLIAILNQGNKLKEEQNALILAQLQISHAQTEQLEIINKFKEQSMYQRADEFSCIIQVLSDIAMNLKFQSDVIKDVSVVAHDDMKTYFSALATYFDFQNTGILRTRETFFGDIVPEFMKDIEGNPIIPREVQVKKYYEQHKETKTMNETDFSKDILDLFSSDFEAPTTLDIGNPFNLLKNVWTLPSDYKIPNNLKEEY
jgi:hypothetical protein